MLENPNTCFQLNDAQKKLYGFQIIDGFYTVDEYSHLFLKQSERKTQTFQPQAQEGLFYPVYLYYEELKRVEILAEREDFVNDLEHTLCNFSQQAERHLIPEYLEFELLNQIKVFLKDEKLPGNKLSPFIYDLCAEDKKDVDAIQAQQFAQEVYFPLCYNRLQLSKLIGLYLTREAFQKLCAEIAGEYYLWARKYLLEFFINFTTGACTDPDYGYYLPGVDRYMRD
jgi:hypothetical protein